MSVPQYPNPPAGSPPPIRPPASRTRWGRWPLAAAAGGIVLVAVALAQRGAGDDPNAHQGQAGPVHQAGVATWDERFTWPDGLSITVARPEPTRPSSNAAALSGPIVRALAVRIVVTNDMAMNYDFNPLMMGPTATFDGQDANEITALATDQGTAGMSTIRPGQSRDYQVAYSVAEQPGVLRLEFSESIGSLPAIFVGQV